MAGEWRRHEVSDLITGNKLFIGDGYRAKNEELSTSGLPFARAGNIDSGFRFEGADHFPEENLTRVGNKVSKSGDVVFTSKGTVGRFAFVRAETPRFVYSPQLCFWRSLDRYTLDPRFLYYWMLSREFFIQFKGVAGQTDMAEYVSLGDQRRMHITVPPLPEQRAIAHILGTLDDKIELNRRMNETLEAMARALFKSWFIDATENGIPKGWRVGTVGDDFNLTMGQSPPGETYNEVGEGLPFFQGRADFGFRYPLRRVYCMAPTRLANSGDTLVSVRAPVGDINMAAEQCCIGRGVAAVRHKTGSRSYTYYMMHSLVDNFGLFEAEGTVFGSIGKDDFLGIKLIIPPIKLVQDFERVVSPIDQAIENNDNQSRALAAIRDALLPKLVSGEIRVRDAEGLLNY